MNARMPSTRVDLADILNRPGASRPVTMSVPAADTLDVPLVTLTADVRVELLLESLVNGILARGSVSADVELACARCLEATPSTVQTEVVELFSDPIRADDADDVEQGYEIRSPEASPYLDLDTLIRDALSDAVPSRPLCREDCRGLCPSCGAQLNTTTCDCADEDVDSRWAALRGLDLPEE